MKKITFVLLLAVMAGMTRAQSETEPNNLAGMGDVVAVNTTLNASMTSGDVDWFIVTLPDDGKLTVNLAASGGLTFGYVQIYEDTLKSYLVQSSWGYASLDVVHNSLAQGTYYVKVPHASNSGTYTISPQFVAAGRPKDAEPNDLAKYASVIAANDSLTGRLNYVKNHVSDQVDWYKVTLPSDGKLEVSLQGEASMAFGYAQLYGDTAQSYIYQSPWGYANTSVYYNALAQDVYYIKVPVANVNYYGSYSIVTRFTPASLSNDAEPNNYAKNAVSLTPNDSLSGRLNYYYRGSTDQVDWFKITLPSDGRLEVLLKGESSLTFGYAQLYNDTAAAYLYQSTWGYSSNKVYYDALSQDDYYVKVPISTTGYYGSYWIVANFIPCTYPNDAEPNDSAKYAVTLNLNDSLTGHLNAYTKGVRDLVDWYKISIPEAGNLRIDLEGINMTFGYIDIYDNPLGSYLARSLWGYSNIYVEASKIPAGTYYVKVPVANGYDSYTIKSSLTPAPKADFTFDQGLYNFSFTNQTILGKTYLWDFGDGQTSTQVNPSHTYNQAGVYDVCLIARSNAGEDTVCKAVTIKGFQSVKADHAGNAGEATIYVFGGGFTSSSTFRFTRDGYADIVGDTVILETKGSLRSTFDLYGKETGKWNVVVTVPGDTVMTIPGGFTIEDARPADPWVDIVGRDRILFNRWQTYTLTYGNNGNEDAKGVPLWFVISDVPGLEIQFADFTIGLPEMAEDSGWTILKEVPVYYTTDHISGESFTARVYPFYIPRVPAGISKSVKIRIKTPESIRVMAWVNKPLYHSPMNSKLSECLYWANAKAVANAATSYIPGVNCAYSVLNHFYDPFEYPMPEENKTKPTWGSMLWGWASTGLTCISNIVPGSAALTNLAVSTVSTTMDFMDGKASVDACYEAFGEKSKKDKPVRAVSSFDPNEIVGPKGYNADNYILKNNALPYTIYFENKNTATAPAHEVIVTDTLDNSVYDLPSFVFGPFGFGDTTVYPEAGTWEFTRDINMQATLNVTARLVARFDTATGVAEWRFVSLDPVTGDTIEDPMTGFLPPNVTSPEGEGFVSFTVGLRADVPDDAKFSNHALIFFDANPAIRTNDYINAIDMNKPQSMIDPLELTDITNSTINLSWSGSDEQSGIRNYTLFVAKNDSAFQPWLVNTGQTSADYEGTPGVTYKFYTVAADSLGNTEDAPEAEDLLVEIPHTAIGKTMVSAQFDIFPNVIHTTAVITVTPRANQQISLSMTDITGKPVIMLADGQWIDAVYRVMIDASQYEPGIYFITLQTNEGFVTKKVIIAR
ncbi:MAG: T9SS type A sorting domain-containing protein [Bacteroidales bacterium]|nr:T9SS type A sorting domain-containing protein [Bacteroidales bacterium]